MTRLDFSWKKDKRYIHFENDHYVVNDDAPIEIREAYARYLKQVEEAQKRGTL